MQYRAKAMEVLYQLQKDLNLIDSEKISEVTFHSLFRKESLPQDYSKKREKKKRKRSRKRLRKRSRKRSRKK